MEVHKSQLMANLGPLLPLVTPNPDPKTPLEQFGLYTDKAYWLPGGHRFLQEFHIGFNGDAKNAENFVVYGFGIFAYTGLPVRSPYDDTMPESTGYQLIADIFCCGDYGWSKAKAKEYFNSLPSAMQQWPDDGKVVAPANGAITGGMGLTRACFSGFPTSFQSLPGCVLGKTVFGPA